MSALTLRLGVLLLVSGCGALAPSLYAPSVLAPDVVPADAASAAVVTGRSPGRGVEGRVVDRDTGAEIAGAVLSARGARGADAETVSDARGAFRLDVAGLASLRADAAGYVRLDARPAVSADSSATLLLLMAPAGGRPMILGADGCRAGWFAVTDDGGTLTWHVAPTLGALLDSPAETIGIDIPIGLTDAGPRACDTAARRALAPRRSASVFPAPVRGALAATTHAEASEARVAAEGKRMSIQAYHILPKIREVDRALRERPADAGRVFEVHPEASFARLNGGEALAHSKKTAAGRLERTALLAPHFGDAPERVVAERPKKEVAADDVLDAFAALWTARRVAAGEARSLPEAPPRDAHGLPMAIWV